MAAKICKSCGKEADISCFPSFIKGGRRYFRNKCKACRLLSYRAWISLNPDRVRSYDTALHREQIKRYKLLNKDRLRHYHHAYAKRRYHTDVQFKLQHRLRNRLYLAIKKDSRRGSAVKDLGCSIDFLKHHIESLFKDGMTWNNYGLWHIDHICPLSKFDLSNREELLKACHYTNLQPLWAKENLSKGTKHGDH